MRAIILEDAGNVDNLQFAEIEKPTIKSDEVLVKVRSISINPVDVKARANNDVLTWIFGEQRPVILGWDISGEVVSVGDGVTKFKLGDEVFGTINFFGSGNAYAEYVAAPENHLAHKPQNTSFEEAAASAMVGSTAYQVLVDVAKIKKGDRVLIHAASGGVGHLAVQIAKHFGAYVIGTSSAKNRNFVLSLGADEHIDYHDENFAEKLKDIDIVLDTIAGETLFHSIDVVRPNGIIVTIPSPDFSNEIKEKAKEKNVNIEFLMVASKSETIAAIGDLLQNEALKVQIDKTFSFDEIREAHLQVETSRTVGKIVVNI